MDLEWIFLILKNIMEQVITLKQTATNFFNFPIILVLNCEKHMTKEAQQ